MFVMTGYLKYQQLVGKDLNDRSPNKRKLLREPSKALANSGSQLNLNILVKRLRGTTSNTQNKDQKESVEDDLLIQQDPNLTENDKNYYNRAMDNEIFSGDDYYYSSGDDFVFMQVEKKTQVEHSTESGEFVEDEEPDVFERIFLMGEEHLLEDYNDDDVVLQQYLTGDYGYLVGQQHGDDEFIVEEYDGYLMDGEQGIVEDDEFIVEELGPQKERAHTTEELPQNEGVDLRDA